MSIKKAKKNTIPVSYEQYLHKDDGLALKSLKLVPFFDKICSKLISIFNEPIYNIYYQSSKIEITSKQLPKIYKMVEDICRKLGIDIPQVYLSPIEMLMLIPVAIKKQPSLSHQVYLSV